MLRRRCERLSVRDARPGGGSAGGKSLRPDLHKHPHAAAAAASLALPSVPAPPVLEATLSWCSLPRLHPPVGPLPRQGGGVSRDPLNGGSEPLVCSGLVVF